MRHPILATLGIVLFFLGLARCANDANALLKCQETHSYDMCRDTLK